MEEQAIKKDYVSWWVDKATEEFERFTEEERAFLSYICCSLEYIELAKKKMLPGVPEKWIKVIDFAKKLSAEYVGWMDKMGYADKMRRYYEENLSPKEITESLGPTVESNKALIIEEADNRGLSGPLREYILSHFRPPGELLGRKESKGELQRH